MTKLEQCNMRVRRTLQAEFGCKTRAKARRTAIRWPGSRRSRRSSVASPIQPVCQASRDWSNWLRSYACCSMAVRWGPTNRQISSPVDHLREIVLGCPDVRAIRDKLHESVRLSVEYLTEVRATQRCGFQPLISPRSGIIASTAGASAGR